MASDKEIIFAIDQTGDVWTLKHRSGGSKGTVAQWTLLPNSDQVVFKRLSSIHNAAWGISADHRVYCYLLKADIPVRVREEIYENQRWNPIGGFCDNRLPTDRDQWSNKEGTEGRTKESVKLPSQSWIWKDDWKIENTFGSEVLDNEGWTYAVDFPATYSAHKDWKSCVRRRKWFRIREFIGYDFWNLIENVQPHEGGGDAEDPAGKFTDVAVSTFGSSHEDISCVWAVLLNGQVYFRKGVTVNQPEGTGWEHVPLPEGGSEASQVTVSANGIPFIVTWTGGIWYRSGVSLHRLEGTGWALAKGPPGGTFQLSVGKNAMWAITRDRKCWALKESLGKSGDGDQWDWIQIPGRMKSINVSKTDLVVLAIGNDDNLPNYRYGVNPDQLHGQLWKEAFNDVSWDAISQSTARSELDEESPDEDELDNVSNSGSGYESEAPLSLTAEIPSGRIMVDMNNFTLPVITSRNITWVDGACASSLKTEPEQDLEVGSWRDDILSGLHFKKLERKQFSYPNAIDTSSTTWSKTTKAKLLHHRKNATWMKGELELNNSETVIFYKDLHHSWMCSINDILSILRSADFPAAFMFRIRNPVDPGMSDFVTVKFENEQDMEEWRSLLLEQSSKSKAQWNMANVWVVTTAGEVLEAGLIKIAESPVNAELDVMGSSSDVKVHHPLLKGFMPGSTITLDFIIPQNCDRFSLNLNGRDCIAFHYNPRLKDQVIVRNSRSTKGDWGEEERDGPFPFVPGQTYALTIECHEKEVAVVLVSSGKVKNKFNWYYHHRLSPKTITHFSAVGDVDILGVRYTAAKVNEGSSEFITSPVPGHFWKVESATQGVTWAIGTDMNVWAHVSKGQSDNVVTAEQVYYIYENQRWNPITGFTSILLPTDRSSWSDETGTIALDKDEIKLPSHKWTWVSDWEVDDHTPGGVDTEGWQYSIDFPAAYHGSKRFSDMVRRRRWKRIGSHTECGPWTMISGVKLIDLCVRMNDDCDYEVLGVCSNGDAVVRMGIGEENVCGTHWESLASQKPFVSIGGHFKERSWAIGKDGFAYIMYHDNWQLLDRPPNCRLKQVRVSPAGIWAVGTNNCLYRRTEVKPVFPEGKEWAKVCEGVLQISLGSDGSVWALVTKGDRFQCSLAKRRGVSESNPAGIGWEVIAEGPWRYVCTTGALQKHL